MIAILCLLLLVTAGSATKYKCDADADCQLASRGFLAGILDAILQVIKRILLLLADLVDVSLLCDITKGLERTFCLLVDLVKDPPPTNMPEVLGKLLEVLQPLLKALDCDTKNELCKPCLKSNLAELKKLLNEKLDIDIEDFDDLKEVDVSGLNPIDLGKDVIPQLLSIVLKLLFCLAQVVWHVAERLLPQILQKVNINSIPTPPSGFDLGNLFRGSYQ